MLFLFTSLSKLPRRKGVENKHNYHERGGFVLINCQTLRLDGKENPRVVSKENNMLKLGTESSRLPKGLQIDSLFCRNNAILKYMCKLKFLLRSSRIKRGVFFSAVILARHAKS